MGQAARRLLPQLLVRVVQESLHLARPVLPLCFPEANAAHLRMAVVQKALDRLAAKGLGESLGSTLVPEVADVLRRTDAQVSVLILQGHQQQRHSLVAHLHELGRPWRPARRGSAVCQAC